MVLKELTLPQRLVLLEALQRWLKPGHSAHQDIKRDLAKRRAGYWSELVLSNFTKYLPDDHTIFHDLQLKHNDFHFQIDTLILTQNYLLVIEAKNIIGTLIFDSIFNQLIRVSDDGKEEVFENPHVQAKRIRSLLRGLLAKHGFGRMPIEYLIFFGSTTKTILKNGPGEHSDSKKVCKGRDVFNKIEAIEQQFSRSRIDRGMGEKLGQLLLRLHNPESINILEEYKLTIGDLRSGIRCPNPDCIHAPMQYKRGCWICSACQTISKDAHIEALKDFFLIIKPSISNSEFCSFVQLPSNNIAQKILGSLHLPTTGKTRNRLYYPWPEKVIPCVS